MTLDARQLARYRSVLETERRRVLSSMGALDDDLESIAAQTQRADVHADVAAVATFTALRERALTIKSHELRLLTQINAALRRIDDGSYGMCAVSGQQIPRARLDAIPWTDRCIEHEGMDPSKPRHSSMAVRPIPARAGNGHDDLQRRESR